MFSLKNSKIETNKIFIRLWNEPAAGNTPISILSVGKTDSGADFFATTAIGRMEIVDVPTSRARGAKNRFSLAGLEPPATGKYRYPVEKLCPLDNG